MITYVNTVLVSNKHGETLATAEDLAGKKTKAELNTLVGKFVFMNCDPSAQDGTAITDVYSYDDNDQSAGAVHSYCSLPYSCFEELVSGAVDMYLTQYKLKLAQGNSKQKSQPKQQEAE